MSERNWLMGDTRVKLNRWSAQQKESTMGPIINIRARAIELAQDLAWQSLIRLNNGHTVRGITRADLSPPEETIILIEHTMKALIDDFRRT